MNPECSGLGLSFTLEYISIHVHQKKVAGGHLVPQKPEGEYQEAVLLSWHFCLQAYLGQRILHALDDGGEIERRGVAVR